MGGGRREPGGPARGSDLRYNLEISLEEAFKGKQTTIRVADLGALRTCHGSGAEPGSQPTTCRTCQGHGRVRAQQGFFTIERTCPTCQGAGTVIEKPCKVVRRPGPGAARKDAVGQHPAGRRGRHPHPPRRRGRGRHARRARRAISTSSSACRRIAIFQRDGANIYCRVPIPITTAALGGTIEVPTVDGSRARVTVPAGTQSGHQFRLRGKGMTVLRSPARGDMYIQAIVETPVNLTKRQQELLREFEKAGENAQDQPGKRRLLRPGEGVLRGSAGVGSESGP